MLRTGRYLVGIGLVGVLVQAAPILAAATDATGTFSVTTPTEVPGAVLKPGAYTIHVVDHLSDRAIVQLDGVNGPTHVTFLGVNAPAAGNEASHPVEWSGKAKGRHALRGFIFQNGSSVEFVYPKADAVALANANSASVVAIDPASEGRPELAKLTNQDMQMVNLWMLTPVRVGPGKGQKGIDARHYEPTVTAAAQTPSTGATQGTSAGAGASTVATTASSTNTSSAFGSAPPRPAVRENRPQTMLARAETPARPVPRHSGSTVKQLPQTASDLPLVWIAGFLCVAGAGVLRSRPALRD